MRLLYNIFNKKRTTHKVLTRFETAAETLDSTDILEWYCNTPISKAVN